MKEIKNGDFSCHSLEYDCERYCWQVELELSLEVNPDEIFDLHVNTAENDDFAVFSIEANADGDVMEEMIILIDHAHSMPSEQIRKLTEAERLVLSALVKSEMARR